ncbi:GNAT family N-acetyltransferase [Paenibacillus sp. CF384]|uniref:GNAT family N-acetyltransferase n=1 Tax=Paenibacillus sp. CF384 TaxID=1884382 RepID=UPI00089732E6|nr:GNAT family N-acetyltransferase [Paenibacillus sp. CF384]SDW21787.1 hypothetical protein SAMN05518855_1001692 [Paenibacillus sp. CF384]
MKLYTDKMSKDAASDILGWRYDEPYDFYNNELSPEAGNEMLEGLYFSVFDIDKRLIGFFCLGIAAQVPNDIYTYSQAYMDTGIGMRPEYTGQGNGTSFLTFVLSYIDNNFEILPKRLTVAKFNQRAICLYKNSDSARKLNLVKGRRSLSPWLRAMH